MTFWRQVPATWKSAGLSRVNLVLSKCTWCITNLEVKLRDFRQVSVVHLEDHGVRGVEHNDKSGIRQTVTLYFTSSVTKSSGFNKKEDTSDADTSIYLLGGHNYRIFSPKKENFTHSFIHYNNTVNLTRTFPKHQIHSKDIFQSHCPLFHQLWEQAGDTVGPLGRWRFSRGSIGHRTS